MDITESVIFEINKAGKSTQILNPVLSFTHLAKEIYTERGELPPDSVLEHILKQAHYNEDLAIVELDLYMTAQEKEKEKENVNVKEKEKMKEKNDGKKNSSSSDAKGSKGKVVKEEKEVKVIKQEKEKVEKKSDDDKKEKNDEKKVKNDEKKEKIDEKKEKNDDKQNNDDEKKEKNDDKKADDDDAEVIEAHTEGFLTVRIHEGKIIVDYSYPSDVAPLNGDWIALFIHDREISYVTYTNLNGDLTGRISFDVPSTDGFYDVRMYQKGVKPEKGKSLELLRSDDFLIGEQVELKVVSLVGNVLTVNYAFANPVTSKRNDEIRLYSEGFRSNRVFLKSYPITIQPNTQTDTLTIESPRLPGRYELRYFVNSVKHVYCGITDSFEIIDRDSVELSQTETDLLINWELHSCDGHAGILSGDWVAIVQMPEEKRITYHWINRAVITDEEGTITIPLDKHFADKTRVAAQLYCHRNKERPLKVSPTFEIKRAEIEK